MAPFPIWSRSEYRLAGRILDVARPLGLDHFHDPVGHRDVIEAFCHLVTVLVRPREEAERFLGGGSVGWLLRYKNERGASNRPRRRAGRVGDDHVEAGRMGP